MAPPTVVLVHSPLVGPALWQEVGHQLLSDYWTVVPRLGGTFDGTPPYYRRFVSTIAEAVLLEDRHAGAPHSSLDDCCDRILVAHSGAGALVPLVAEALPNVTQAVFVDAILPHPGRTWFDTAPPALAEHLRSLAVDGVLPPWHGWFPPEAIDALLPDPEARARFIDELPRVPLAYFEEPAPAVAALPARCSYLQLSDAYEEVADEADSLGWPVMRVNMHHLAPLTDPACVAALLRMCIVP